MAGKKDQKYSVLMIFSNKSQQTATRRACQNLWWVWYLYADESHMLEQYKKHKL